MFIYVAALTMTRLLSAMSFRSTRSLAAASVGSDSSRSATSSRKSYRG